MSFRTVGVRTLVGALVTVVFGVRAQGSEVLTLESVQAAALDSQPLIDGQRARVDASRERAIVAGQLPDPEFGFGVSELPIDTADAWSFRRDTDTDIMVGITQTFPRAAKRRLRQLREERTTQAAEEELHDLERRVQRDAGLAFAEMFLRRREVELIEDLLRQAGLQSQSTEIRFRSGDAPQSEFLGASVEEALLRDRLTEARQMFAHARLQLERWIGRMANQPVGSALPDLTPPVDLADILNDLPDHPALRMNDRAREAAEAGLDLARQSYKPDWRLELAYGHRPEFSEMLTVRASIGLPIFPRKRQDRKAAAARHDVLEATFTRANRLREFQTEAALAHHDGRLFSERLRALQSGALPAARARVDAADAAYRTGNGALADVLAARQGRLEVELRTLDLAVSAFRKQIELQYFVNRGAQP